MSFTLGRIAYTVPRLSRSIRMSYREVAPSNVPTIRILEFNIFTIGADLPYWIAPPSVVCEHRYVLFCMRSILGDFAVPKEHLADW